MEIVLPCSTRSDGNNKMSRARIVALQVAFWGRLHCLTTFLILQRVSSTSRRINFHCCILVQLYDRDKEHEEMYYYHRLISLPRRFFKCLRSSKISLQIRVNSNNAHRPT